MSPQTRHLLLISWKRKTMNPLILDETIDPKEAREIFDKMAGKIVDLHLTTPAILFLESMGPLNFIGAHVLLFFQPLLGAFFDLSKGELVAKLFMERENLDRFITTIEEKDREKRDV